jgi:hypothetical protein
MDDGIGAAMARRRSPLLHPQIQTMDWTLELPCWRCGGADREASKINLLGFNDADNSAKGPLIIRSTTVRLKIELPSPALQPRSRPFASSPARPHEWRQIVPPTRRCLAGGVGLPARKRRSALGDPPPSPASAILPPARLRRLQALARPRRRPPFPPQLLRTPPEAAPTWHLPPDLRRDRVQPHGGPS